MSYTQLDVAELRAAAREMDRIVADLNSFGTRVLAALSMDTLLVGVAIAKFADGRKTLSEVSTILRQDAERIKGTMDEDVAEAPIRSGEGEQVDPWQL